jgi:peptidoglycan/xylan/chitin deacetylase (PgdA/CDA1 family)
MRRFAAAASLLILSLSLPACGGSEEQASAKPNQRQTTEAIAGPATWKKPLLPNSKARVAPVPILMYHVVSQAKAGVAYPDLWVSKETFASEINALKAAGFEGITLNQLWVAWHGTGELPQKPIVVSFDDGYLSHWTHAAPVLKAAGWPGVLNLEVKNIGNDGIPVHMVKGLIRNGWEIDSHTITHPDLPSLSSSAVTQELVGSRDAISKQFGVRPWFFCYPAGNYNVSVQQAVKAAGYLGATTVEPGWATPNGDPYAMPRVRVNGSDTAQSLLSKVDSSKPA